jgi:REP element-mobilizing transposase RayT
MNCGSQKRDLPHWRLDTSTYFVTWRLRRDIAWLTMEERLLVCDTIKHFDGIRYKLYVWVVMNDHAHVVLRLMLDFQLDKVTHAWKSYSANQLQRLFGREVSVWVTESWDRGHQGRRRADGEVSLRPEQPCKALAGNGRLSSLWLGWRVAEEWVMFSALRALQGPQPRQAAAPVTPERPLRSFIHY